MNSSAEIWNKGSVKTMKDSQDAFGHGLYDRLNGENPIEMVERNDGFIDASGFYQMYFREDKDWSDHQKKAMSYIEGRVLDIGCGAGGHSLHLQEKGFDVLATDISPLAIKVCRMRGIKRTKALPITQITSRLGTFDTILLLGGNFGLLGNFKRARYLLRRFKQVTSKKARIVAESTDPYKMTEPCHLEYHRLNQKRKRMPGQWRVRVGYKKDATAWIYFLLVSKEEMRRIVSGTGWKINRILESKSPRHIAILEKEAI